MRLLLNELDDTAGARPGDRLDDVTLASVYAYPRCEGGRSWVRANFVSTLDGAATGADGKSGSINTGADREVFTLLRALADVILVGAGTARVEGYRRPVVADKWGRLGLRQGRSDHPVLAVVSRSARLPTSLCAGQGQAGDVLLLTCEAAGNEAIRRAEQILGEDRVVVQGDQSVKLATALDDLAKRGLPRILCEGGAHLLHDVIDSGRLDELCLTITAKVVAGPQARILVGPGITEQLVPRLLIESQGTLLGRWIRPDDAGSAIAGQL
jgi:riboflavin biosynthesis pyrimidine reductase